MKIRDSGMPDADTWERFFDPQFTLRRLRFVVDHEDVADLGCGYGTFSIAAAQLTRGTVYALDIEREMVAATARRRSVTA
jgi:predicted RNA methylase